MGLDAPVPEEGYQGDYLLDLADELIARWATGTGTPLAAAPDVTARLPAEGGRRAQAGVGRDAILAQFRVTLDRLRVPFDVWTPESTLYEGEGEHRGFGGRWESRSPTSRRREPLYDEEGACWLTTTRYGDDKDRVLIRQTGDHTCTSISANIATTATRWTAGSST